MNTNPNQPSAKKQLKSGHDPLFDARWSQSAAIRGATKAFTAEGNGLPTNAFNSGTSGARAAALSAENASRQKSETSVPVPPAPFRSQFTGASQVQQLVRNYEQSTTSERVQAPERDGDASKRLRSRSTSRTAARIALNSSPLREPLLHGEVRKTGVNLDNASHTVQRVSNAGYEPQPKASQSEPPESTIKITALRPLQPVSSRQPSSAQNSSAEKDFTAPKLERYPNRNASSMLAAQIAVRKTADLSSSGFPEPPGAENDALNSHIDPSHNTDSRRSSNEEKRAGKSNFNPNDRAPDQPRYTTDETSSDNRKPRPRNASNSRSLLRTQSTQSLTRHPSTTPTPKPTSSRPVIPDSSLASALAASSLASSRASSPAGRIAPPPPPTRSSVSRSLFRRHHSSDTDLPRRASPSHKGMRQTLRRDAASAAEKDEDEQDVRRNHRHFIKHPNKHREGSRKRWKDRVTERERRRFEGVWAANKGMFVPGAGEGVGVDGGVGYDEMAGSEVVLDLVVRDVWSRSRLPADALAEVWELVDQRRVGVLGRAEFVLGLWLIDQRLKGRKLPMRVSETLRTSVTHVLGVRVPQRK